MKQSMQEIANLLVCDSTEVLIALNKKPFEHEGKTHCDYTVAVVRSNGKQAFFKRSLEADQLDMISKMARHENRDVWQFVISEALMDIPANYDHEALDRAVNMLEAKRAASKA